MKLVRPDAVENFNEYITREYRAATNIDPDIYVVKADDGAREEVTG